MLCIPYQLGMPLLGYGGSGQVYEINDTIVLKSPLIYELLPGYTTADQDDYKCMTTYSYRAIEHEKSVFRKLGSHRNIVHALATNHPEGIYLQKHGQLREKMREPSVSWLKRLLWYQDMASALLHLHSLNLAHADVRLPNWLCDGTDCAILCDFTSTEEIGTKNEIATIDEDGIVDLNGLSSTLSDATDRFAFSSLIYEMETGEMARITAPSGKLRLPPVQTGCPDLDLIIWKGWRGTFTSTSDLLRDLKILGLSKGCTDERATPELNLGNDVFNLELWRQSREQEHGTWIFLCNDGRN